MTRRKPRCWHHTVFGLLKKNFFPSRRGLIEVPRMAYRRLLEIKSWYDDLLGAEIDRGDYPLSWRGCPILDGTAWDYAE